jgi:hypothetical protein
MLDNVIVDPSEMKRLIAQSDNGMKPRGGEDAVDD